MQRGEIWHLKGVADDDENKARPLVVVSRDAMNNGNCVVAVPLYSRQLEKRGKAPFCVFLRRGEGGVDRDCVAKCDEIATIDKTRIDFRRGKKGRLSAEKMGQICQAIRFVIDDE
jgi:mRNA-degrading endonuclease toxin of MazEF toxin-antitoxin module